MFVRSFREPAAVLGFLVCLLPAASFAASHHGVPGGPGALQRGPAFTFSLGRGAASSLHFRDFTHVHETLKPLELPATPKPIESAFPSFSNPLHRHRMALITF